DIDGGTLGLRPSPLLCPLHCNQRVASVQQRDTHRHLVLLVVELVRPCALSFSHLKDAPTALLYPGTHNLLEHVLALQHRPAAQHKEVVQSLLQAYHITILKQKLLHVQKISVGCVFTREQFAFFNQRGTNLLEEGSAAFAACRTYIAPHYTALCGRIEKARVYSGDLRKQRILSFAAAFPEVRCVKVCRIDAVTLRVRGKQPQGPYLPGYSLQSLLCLERSDRILREHLNLFGVAFYRHRFRHQQDHQVLLYARPVHS